jgi:hypothetical protein
MRRLDGPRRRDVAVDPAGIDEAYLQAPTMQADRNVHVWYELSYFGVIGLAVPTP